jgi:Fatty acid desaturase
MEPRAGLRLPGRYRPGSGGLTARSGGERRWSSIRSPKTTCPHHQEIATRLGRDGAWGRGSHDGPASKHGAGIALRDYLILTRRIDPVALERARMAQMCTRCDSGAKTAPQAVAHVSFQELATRVSHRDTGTPTSQPEPGSSAGQRVRASRSRRSSRSAYGMPIRNGSISLCLGGQRRVGVLRASHSLGDGRGEVVGQLVDHVSDLVELRPNTRTTAARSALAPSMPTKIGRVVSRPCSRSPTSSSVTVWCSPLSPRPGRAGAWYRRRRSRARPRIDDHRSAPRRSSTRPGPARLAGRRAARPLRTRSRRRTAATPRTCSSTSRLDRPALRPVPARPGWRRIDNPARILTFAIRPSTSVEENSSQAGTGTSAAPSAVGIRGWRTLTRRPAQGHRPRLRTMAYARCLPYVEYRSRPDGFHRADRVIIRFITPSGGGSWIALPRSSCWPAPPRRRP